MYLINYGLRRKLHEFFYPQMGSFYAVWDEITETPLHTCSVQYNPMIGKWSIEKRARNLYKATYHDCTYTINAVGLTPKLSYQNINRLVRKIERVDY